MQASVPDIGWVSRFARIGCLKQLPVVAIHSAIDASHHLSYGNQMVICRISAASDGRGGHRRRSRTWSDDQNEPLASRRFGPIVLERNIVNRTRPAARDGSKALSRSCSRCNRALEQSFVQRLSVRSGADAEAMEPVPRVAQKIGTNGEENWSVKLYARLQSTRAKDSRATFTECYAVPAMIGDGTPGKGDGS